jgi:uncharacterized DUF497 family protein
MKPWMGTIYKPLIEIDRCVYLKYTLDMFKGSVLTNCTGFQWDQGNLLKNWEKHGVSAPECEQIFFNRPFITGPDKKHSQQEDRLYALGQTDAGRLLFVVFSIRENLVRVISARDMNQRERKVYKKS